jgi:hypothetical protein
VVSSRNCGAISFRNEAGSDWEIGETFRPEVNQQDTDKIFRVLCSPLKLQIWILVSKTVIYITIYLFLFLWC